MAKLDAGNWISVAGIALAVAMAAGGISLRVYATRDDCMANKHEVEKKVIVTEQQNVYQTQEIKRLHVRVENIDAKQEVIHQNIEKLVRRQGLRPAVRSEPKSVPAPAAPPPAIFDKFEE